MECGESLRAREVELHDVDDDITRRHYLYFFFFSREISRRRSIRRDLSCSRGGLKTRESEKFPSGELALFSFRRCLPRLARINLFGVTVQRPQVSAQRQLRRGMFLYVERLRRNSNNFGLNSSWNVVVGSPRRGFSRRIRSPGNRSPWRVT